MSETNVVKDESGVAQRSELQPVVKRFIELSGEYHADCNALFSRIAELENALEDAKIFANYIECLGRTNCEIYKHELKSSAYLSLSRIDSAIGV